MIAFRIKAFRSDGVSIGISIDAASIVNLTENGKITTFCQITPGRTAVANGELFFTKSFKPNHFCDLFRKDNKYWIELNVDNHIYSSGFFIADY